MTTVRDSHEVNGSPDEVCEHPHEFEVGQGLVALVLEAAEEDGVGLILDLEIGVEVGLERQDRLGGEGSIWVHGDHLENKKMRNKSIRKKCDSFFFANKLK